MEGLLLVLAVCGMLGVWFLREAVIILRKIYEEFQPARDGARGIRDYLWGIEKGTLK